MSFDCIRHDPPAADRLRQAVGSAAGVLCKATEQKVNDTMYGKAQDAVGLIVYEWKMLQWAYKEGRKAKREFASMVVECFTLHARVLRDFFCKSRANNGGAFDDDILAEDFFDDPSKWRDKRPELGPYMQSRKRRFDKALAHLSYERLEFEKSEKKWNLTTMEQELEVQWKAFLDLLSEDRRNWFLTEMRK